jgi:hypothetical protein
VNNTRTTKCFARLIIAFATTSVTLMGPLLEASLLGITAAAAEVAGTVSRVLAVML